MKRRIFYSSFLDKSSLLFITELFPENMLYHFPLVFLPSPSYPLILNVYICFLLPVKILVTDHLKNNECCCVVTWNSNTSEAFKHKPDE